MPSFWVVPRPEGTLESLLSFGTHGEPLRDPRDAGIRRGGGRGGVGRRHTKREERPSASVLSASLQSARRAQSGVLLTGSPPPPSVSNLGGRGGGTAFIRQSGSSKAPVGRLRSRGCLSRTGRSLLPGAGAGLNPASFQPALQCKCFRERPTRPLQFDGIKALGRGRPFSFQPVSAQG